MRMDKLTSRFQQALADAQSLAVGRDNNIMEPVHVMAALLDAAGRLDRAVADPGRGQRAGADASASTTCSNGCPRSAGRRATSMSATP